MKMMNNFNRFVKPPDAWRVPELWNYAEADGTGIQFDSAEAGISEEAAHNYSVWPFAENYLNRTIRPDQLPTLLPHLRTYGWPGESSFNDSSPSGFSPNRT